MAIQNMKQFKREMNQLAKLPEDMWIARSAILIGDVIKHLIRLTSDAPAVKTGAYRASHTVEQDGYIVYESPNRPDVNERVKTIKDKRRVAIKTPTTSGIRRVAEANLTVGSFQFVNPRIYASQVERRHHIYRLGYDFARNRAAQLVDLPFTAKEKKKYNL